jgi:hypothetical protein
MPQNTIRSIDASARKVPIEKATPGANLNKIEGYEN